ncbi:glycoside hydrolase family 125 protein [Luteococcus peritonei]|uniref:Glycoside hydrolase family 125 protein n=1 Tax=Luteococcus peritonei TaxID=88874 RepID=A0ABW4RSV3_9ACTN
MPLPRPGTLVPALLRPGSRRPPEPLPLPEPVRALLEQRGEAVETALGHGMGRLYRDLMGDTWTRTLRPGRDGVFVVTGDIPAMWLRDSSAQMRPWLALAAHSTEVAGMLRGVVRMQWHLLGHDRRANAFNRGPVGGTHHLLDDHVWRLGADPWIWERKYELDSLALPIQLAHQLWRATGQPDHLGSEVRTGLDRVVELWRLEQDHESSDYRFVRLDAVLRRQASESLPRRGRGAPVARTGMTWQGFRPSDDACTFGYNVPGNLTAAHSLHLAAELAREVWADEPLALRCERLAEEIRAGVAAHAHHPEGGWYYEVDGLGGSLAADDANLPSLLGLPLTAGVDRQDRDYLATRARVLSGANPWWHRGRAASGISSPHTPGARVWPIALAVQGLTATSREEAVGLARLLAATTADTGMMHESFHVDDPADFTRAWFSWANMMFCELVDQLAHGDEEVRWAR